MVNAEVTSSGELSFEGQIAGRIQGFRYTPDANIRGEVAALDDAEMAGVLAKEYEVRANRLSEAVDAALVLANDGAIRWLGEPIAKIAAGDSLLAPRALILADESLAAAAQQKAQSRIELWLIAYIRRLLGPLFELESGVGLEGAARNVALQLVENLGVLERARVAHDVKALDQNARGLLRKLGVRFGAYYIYIPSLVKPAIRVLATQLWALRQGGSVDGADLHEIPQLAASGRTSFLADQTVPKETYRVAGFRLCGERAVRVDIVERLADLIRPAVAYRSGMSAGEPPAGSADGDGFVVTGAMTSLTGCSGEQFASVLRSLGFVSHLVKGPALTPREKPADPAEVTNEAPVSSESAPPSAAEIGLAGDPAPAVERDETAALAPVDEAEGAGDPPDAAVAEGAMAPSAAEATGEARSSWESAPSSAAETGLAGDPAPAVERDETAALAPVDETEDAGDSPDAAVAEDATARSAAEATYEATNATAPPTTLSDEILGEPTTEPDNAEQVAQPEQSLEVLIEVWRPRPPANRQRRPRGDNVRAKTSPQIVPGDSQAVPRGGAHDEADKRRRRPHSRSPQPSAVEVDAASKREPDKLRSGRSDRRHFGASKNPQSAVAEQRGPDADKAPGERGHRERRPERHAPPVARREPPINLDSPFAKLLALKLQLETKGKAE